jgi:glycosyltransferase involved in cell wall biosynthesis
MLNADRTPLVSAATERAEGRTLVLRSCRAEQFAAAVHLARSRMPGARVAGLTVEGHRHAALEGGVDDVIEVPGHRFSPMRTSPWTLARLRSLRFDEVVIPQMIPDAGRHLNVYALAAMLRAERFVVVPGSQPPQVLDRRGYRTLLWRALREWFALRFDTPIFIALVIASCMIRRPRVPAGAPTRRRLLHIVSSLGTGGAQVQLAQLLNRLPREQYQVDLLLVNPSAGSSSRRLIARDDIDIACLTTWPNRTRMVLEIVAHCRSRQYDLVHTWLPGMNIMAGSAARLARVPRVVTSIRGMSKARKWWYSEWWWRPLDVLTSWAADAVTVNARALVADHARFACMPPERIHVVHNGLDPSSLVADREAARADLRDLTHAPAGAVLVGNVGRLVHEKDHATFLQMLARVRAMRPDVHGVIIGNGRLRADLEQLTTNLGLTNAVTFLGDRPDARRLMAGFDLFVFPSISEGFPNVLLEATFLGVPCVASDIGGIGEVLGPDSVLFEPGDVHACAQQVLAALADPARATAHGEAVRARALELFTAERSVSAWMALYRHCLETPAGSLSPVRADAQPLGAAGDL